MQNKLQELTDKLYNEGLSKGKQEAEELLNNAKKEAQHLVAAAKEEAASIIKNAQKESAELKSKAEGDIKMASVQTLASVKQKLESAITFKNISAPVNNLLSDSSVLKSVITTVVKAFAERNEGKSLELLLPEDQKKSVDEWVKSSLGEFCKEGVNVAYSRDIPNGFKISQKGDGYYLDFTAGAFEKIIAEYIRPKTRKLLFGE